MLITFSVQNYKSIRDLQTLSLEARTDDHLAWSHVIEEGKHRLVKSAAIFGPNASGKSNVIEAMITFRQLVVNSSREGQKGDPLDVHPFRLCTATESAPTRFEVEFLLESAEYRYGFEATRERVESEWLFRKSGGAKPARLFVREGQKIEVSAAGFKEGKGLEERTRENALFLSVCAQFAGPEAERILGWMRRFRAVSGLSEAAFFVFTAERLQNPEHQRKLLELARKADFNITSLRSELEEVGENSLPPHLNEEAKKRILSRKPVQAGIRTTHEKRDADGQVVGDVEFDLEQDESEGTKKFVALSGPLTLTLEEGSILLVDELEARLHPRLTQAIVDLFHSPVNRRNAQLICATHDVTLLESDRFRRDQVWFCEKDETGATDLYSLAEFDKNQVRPSSKFSRQYMLGLFGAVPQLTHFEEAADYATR